jgi:hypothetical protein
MEELRLTYTELLAGFVVFNSILGFLFGVFPLLVGLRLKNRKYGVFGLLTSVFGGVLAGVLIAFPAAAVFTWLILRSVNTSQPDSEEPGTSEMLTAAEQNESNEQ